VSTPAAPFVVSTPAEMLQHPAEYQELVKKIIVSHAINELAGAIVYDEPAIAFAPTPYWKWHACRIAMEEYGHHVRFAKMGAALGVPEDAMIPGRTAKKSLNIFDTTLGGWAEFCVLKMIGDLAEILQVEDLLKCSYLPLRKAAKITMPEEKFHATFGERACTELVETPEGRRGVQAGINKLFPTLPAFFGRANSKNNELYRKWGIKERTNEEMRTDYLGRARFLVEKLDLTLPALPAA
jgi:ring-1,2-phenylacetyl-CoA epoxidase subunit PaaA